MFSFPCPLLILTSIHCFNWSNHLVFFFYFHFRSLTCYIDFLAPLPGHLVNLACIMMASVSSKVEGLAEVTALVYNSTNGILTCLDPDTEYIECADPTGCGLGLDSPTQDHQVLGGISYLPSQVTNISIIISLTIVSIGCRNSS